MAGLGDIGNALGSFSDAYRAENQRQIQNALAKRQMDIEGAKAYGAVLGEGGSDAANPLLGKLGLVDTSGTQPTQVAQDQSQPQQELPSQQQQPGGAFVPSKFQRGLISHYMEANDKEQDTGIHYNYDPKTGQVQKTQVPFGPKAQAELDSSRFGSRSPNAELTSQYDKSAGPVRSSQNAMNQMIDAYEHPGPHSDASLVLNAFKIKFPNAPDVQSIEELNNAPGATDKMKNWVSQSLAGLKDPETRNSLLRDGISTYRANVDSLHGIQKRYQARSKYQGVNDPTLTTEPAIEDTYAKAMDLDKRIGPYVPNTQRPGLMNKIQGKIAGLVGVKGAQSAVATPGAPKMGEIQQGYRFKGGDPSKPTSWEPVK